MRLYNDEVCTFPAGQTRGEMGDSSSNVQRVSAIEAVLRRDRIVVVAGLGLVTAIAWGWTLLGAGHSMSGMQEMTAPVGSAVLAPASWSLSHAGMMFLMWWIMMVAMMLPSAAPLGLLAAAIHRRAGGPRDPALLAGFLAAGYLAVWGAFSLAATLAQWGLEATRLLDTSTLSARRSIAGAILVGAGVYQITPFKQACLSHCRSPLEFLTTYWRPGALGSLRMGVHHGAYCLGCCWFLMALLFVGGIMNPFWIGAIALYVLLEKFSPRGERLSRATGVALAGAGVVILLLEL